MTENTPVNFTKWFRSEVAIAFAVGSVVAGVLIYFNKPVNALETQVAVIQNQIAELKSNDLVHIELEQTTTAATLAAQQTQIINIGNNMTEVLTILKQQKK